MMASNDSSGEVGFQPQPASAVSRTFIALRSLFAECLRDVWTPMSAEQRDQLTQRFSETLSRHLAELDAVSFCTLLFQLSSHSVY